MSVVLGLLCVWVGFAGEGPAVSINGKPVSAEAWAYLTLTRGAPLATTEPRLIEQLIDRELLRGFLDQQKVVAEADVVDLRMLELEELIRRRGGEPAAVFAKLGLNVDQVRKELALGVAWERYVEQTVSVPQLQAHFDAHRAELDGTRVQAQQVFRKATSAADQAAAETLLAQVRGEIVAGKLTFSQAAEQYSQAPSGKQGGDVGWIVGLGQLPAEVARAALQLEPGKISSPVRTPLGVHLVMVTEKQAGQLSLEDVRPQILEQIAADLWSRTASQLRQSARIVRPAE